MAGTSTQRPERLYRFGWRAETAAELAAQAAAAEAHPEISLHGVSVSSAAKYPAPSATWEEVTTHFPVVKTGKSPTHWTVVLPKPVRQEDADRFNLIFQRGAGRP